MTYRDNFKKIQLCVKFLNNLFDLKFPMTDTYKVSDPGIYIILDNNFNVIYIGESINIYKRVNAKNHIFDKNKHKILCLLIHYTNYRIAAESILIAALNPIKNKIKYVYGCRKKN